MYISGRSVKSSKAKPSPIAQATAEGRRLAERYLPAGAFPIIKSVTCYGLDGVRRMKTTILFAEMDRAASKPLADAVAKLDGYHSMCWNSVSIEYLRSM